MKTYTMRQWKKDRVFKAEPGQEVSAEVYEIMHNCLPPKRLPVGAERKALEEYNLPIHAGFLMGEPQDYEGGHVRFLAFGSNTGGKKKHYYYLGLSTPELED